jgi:hypothetical protein
MESHLVALTAGTGKYDVVIVRIFDMQLVGTDADNGA